MFGLGWQEILVILAVAVLVIGPDQLPQVARTLGKLITQFKRASNDLRQAVSEEINQHPEYGEFKEFQNTIQSEVQSIGHTAQDFVEKEMEQEERELKKLEKEITADTAAAGSPADMLPTGEYGPRNVPSDTEQQALDDSTQDDEEEDSSRKQTA